MHAGFTFSHVGVAVADLTQATRSYEQVFGYRVLAGPFDDPAQRVSVCFMGSGQAGDVEVELVAPLSADSPVRGILAKGGGAYHICYSVPDVEAAIASARESGCLLVSGPTPAVAYAGRRIAWLYLPSRQLFELVEAEGN